MAIGLGRPGALPEDDPRDPANPLRAAAGQPVAVPPVPTIEAPALATTVEAQAAGRDFQLPQPEDLPPLVRPAPIGIGGPATLARAKLQQSEASKIQEERFKDFVQPTARNLAISRAGVTGAITSAAKEAFFREIAAVPAGLAALTDTAGRALSELTGLSFTDPKVNNFIQKNEGVLGFMADERAPLKQFADWIAGFGKGGPVSQDILDQKILADITVGGLAGGAGSLAGFLVGTLAGGPVVKSIGAGAIGLKTAQRIAGGVTGAGSAIARGHADALESKPDIGAADLALVDFLQTLVGVSEIAPLELAFRPFRRGAAQRIIGFWESGATTAAAEALQESGGQFSEALIAKTLFDADRKLMEGVAEGAEVGGVLGFVLGGLTGLLGKQIRKRTGLLDLGDESDVVEPPPPPADGPAGAAVQATEDEAPPGGTGEPSEPVVASEAAQAAVGPAASEKVAELDAEIETLDTIVGNLQKRKATEGKNFRPQSQQLLTKRLAEKAQLVADRLAAAANASKEVVTEEGAAGKVTSEVAAQEAETLSVVEAQIAQQKASIPAGTTLDPDSRLAKQIAVTEKRRDELLEKREAREASTPEAKKTQAEAKAKERKAKAEAKAKADAEEKKVKAEARAQERLVKAEARATEKTVKAAARAKATAARAKEKLAQAKVKAKAKVDKEKARAQKRTDKRKAEEAAKAARKSAAKSGTGGKGRAAKAAGAPGEAQPTKRGKAAKVEPAPGEEAGEAGGAAVAAPGPVAGEAPAAGQQAPGGAAERAAPGGGAQAVVPAKDTDKPRLEAPPVGALAPGEPARRRREAEPLITKAFPAGSEGADQLTKGLRETTNDLSIANLAQAFAPDVDFGLSQSELGKAVRGVFGSERAPPGAGDVTELIRANTDKRGQFTLPGDTLRKDLEARSDDEIAQVMRFAGEQSAHVKRNVQSTAAVILRARGVKIDEIAVQQAILEPRPAEEATPPAAIPGAPGRPPENLTNGQINNELGRLGKRSSTLTDRMIADGRGNERPNETRKKTDPLSRLINLNSARLQALQIEKEQRVGPKFFGRLPKGGARVKVEAAPKETAAEAKLADKALKEADRREKIRVTQAKNHEAGRTPDATVDDLHTAVAKLDGMNRADAEEHGLIEPNVRSPRQSGGIRPVFTENGRSADDLAQILGPQGYPVSAKVRSREGQQAASENTLLAALEKSLGAQPGRGVFSTKAGDKQLDQVAADRLADERARREDEALGATESRADPADDPFPGDALLEEEIPAAFDTTRRRMGELADELNQLKKGAGTALVNQANKDDLFDIEIVKALEEAVSEQSGKRRAGVAAGKRKKGTRPKKEVSPKPRIEGRTPEGEGARQEKADIARVRERLNQRATGKTPFPVSDAVRERARARVEVFDTVVDNPAGISGVELSNARLPEGSTATPSQRMAIITPDSIEPGKWRVTFFDRRGFSGHETLDTAADALADALQQGFDLVAPPGTLDRIFRTPDFQEGLKVTEEIRKLNEASFQRSQAELQASTGALTGAPQADLAPEATTAEQVRAKRKEVEERLAPKKEPDVTAGPLFDLAERQDFEKKQGDLFAPVSVPDTERLGKNPKEKKALGADAQARATGTRKPHTDLAGDPVEAHEWSKDTQIDSLGYTLKVNDRRTPKAIILHEALTRARKYTNNAISNFAHETFNIPFKQSRRALTQALSDLIDGGMPEAWVDGIRKFVAEPQVLDSTAVGAYSPESRTLAMRADILDDTANIPLETQIGLPAPPITAATILRNQRHLTNMVAHELAHSIDFSGRGQRMNRRANSWASPLFTVDITSMDFRTTDKGKRVLNVPEHSMGPALHELYTIYDQNIAGLRKYFGYPFSELPLLVEDFGLTQMERVRTGQLIKHEGFAQGAALYFTHRAIIEKNAPTFAQLMKEIIDGTPRTESARKRDVRLHTTFQRTPAARDSKVDQLEPVDQTAPASRQVREEAAGIQSLRRPRVEAQVPARDAEREYTPGQVAITEKGGFGKLPPFNLRKKVKDFIEGARKLNYGALRQLIFDQYHSFDDILDDPIAHMKATLSAGANSVMDAIVLYGIPRMDESGAILVGTRLVVLGTDKEGRTVRKVVRLKGKGKEGFEKGVAEVLEPLGLEVQDWFQWMVGNRSARLLAEDREKLFADPDDIPNLLSFADGELPSDPTPGSRLRLYQEVRAEFEEINNAIVDIGVQLGTIRAEDAATWADEGFYIPFYRMLADQSAQKGNAGPNTDVALVRQSAIEHLKGSPEQLADPLQNALLNWHHILGSSLRNAAGARALESAMNMGIVTRLTATEEEVEEAEAAGEEVPGVSAFTAKRKDVVWIREKGEKVFYQFNDPEASGLTKEDHARVLTSLEGLTYEGLNNQTMRAMRFMKRQLTGIVVANPNFKIANGWRDAFQALAVAGLSMNPVKNFMKGWQATKATSATNIAGLSTAGFFEQSGYVHGSDPEAIRRLESRGVKRNTILDFTNPRVLIDLWKSYQDFGVRIENVQRAAQFETDLERGKTLLETAFNARDLLDFSRHGSSVAVRILGQTIPFFQARLQGLDRFGRGYMDQNQRRQFLTVVGAYSVASVMLYAWMKDDEDYKNAEQWERDTYHLFKIPGSDLLFRIPRPFEVGVIATILERFAEQIVDEDAHAELFFDRIKFAGLQTFAFNPVPQAALPVWELWGNRNSFTGRPIESVSMANLKIEDRRRIYTSETSVLLAKGYNSIVWENIEMSPVQLEHLVQGYFSWAGSAVLGTVDMLLTRPAFGEPPRPARQLQDMPFMGRWVREAPARHTGPAEVYFEMLKDAQQTFNSIQKARKDGDAGRRQAIFQDNKALLSQRRQLTRSQRQIGKINDRIQRVTRSRKLSSDQKRQKINALRRRTQKIQGKAIGRARSAGVQ